MNCAFCQDDGEYCAVCDEDTEDTLQIKVWCPLCGEEAHLDAGERAEAELLAKNHDENHHDGKSQTFVSGVGQ